MTYPPFIALLLLGGVHALAACPQDDAWIAEALPKRIAEGPLPIELQPYSGPIRSLGWSPKGTQFPLQVEATGNERRSVLYGKFTVGEQAEVKVRLQLSDPSDKARVDSAKAARTAATLQVDTNGNGSFEPDEAWTVNPSISRGKVWYSGEANLLLPASEIQAANRTRSYPVALWYVEDPSEPEADPVMRWSRRGWHSGTATVAGQELLLVVSDSNADGLFTQVDAWGLQPAAEPRFNIKNSAFKASAHAWLGEIPYRIKSLDRYGRSAVIEAFDLGRTREEDEKNRDPYAADREHPRAEKPVTFLTDFEAAVAKAEQEDRWILVDFVTTWCGPCRVMDQLVYTAAPAAEACARLICVKLDGDEEKQLAKRFEVKAFPTLLLLSPDGKLRERRTGYQSASKLVGWIEATIPATGK